MPRVKKPSIFDAIRNDEFELVKALIEEDPSIVNSEAPKKPADSKGMSPLQVAVTSGWHRKIVYKKLSENELSRIIKMRIDQLTEEYTSEGRTVPRDVDLEASLMDFYKRNLAAGTYVSWLAFDGDKIVGTSGMSFAEKPPYFTCPSGKLGILSSMYTDPNYRRRGIATELLGRVVKEAKEYGCGTIYITASDMGVKLYEAYGFKHNGNFMQYNFNQ